MRPCAALNTQDCVVWKVALIHVPGDRASLPDSALLPSVTAQRQLSIALATIRFVTTSWGRSAARAAQPPNATRAPLGADKSQVSGAEDDERGTWGRVRPPSRPFAGARGGARVRAAAGIEATTAREWSGRGEGAASARGQTGLCLAMDLQHRRGGDPGTLGSVGATLPGRARVLRPACEHETLRTGVLVGARGFEPPTSSSRTMRATKLRHAPTEVLVEQSRWIVARVARSRRGRGAATAAAHRGAEAQPAAATRPAARPVPRRTTWAPSLAQKYQETGVLPYERPISRRRRRP